MPTSDRWPICWRSCLDVRRATLSFLRGLRADTWTRRGIASGKEVSVRAMAYAIAGHARHHLEVLAERYR